MGECYELVSAAEHRVVCCFKVVSFSACMAARRKINGYINCACVLKPRILGAVSGGEKATCCLTYSTSYSKDEQAEEAGWKGAWCVAVAGKPAYLTLSIYISVVFWACVRFCPSSEPTVTKAITDLIVDSRNGLNLPRGGGRQRGIACFEKQNVCGFKGWSP